MRTFVRAVIGAGLAATLVAPVTVHAHPQDHAHDGVKPVLSGLSLTEPAIHAVRVRGTHLPKRTHLLLTLSDAALVRIRVKDTDPYGLSRAFDVTLPAGDAEVPISARVDGTRLPPGRYQVVVKAHNSAGSSEASRLNLRIVGRNG
jgi:hypothetical protein